MKVRLYRRNNRIQLSYELVQELGVEPGSWVLVFKVKGQRRWGLTSVSKEEAGQMICAPVLEKNGMFYIETRVPSMDYIYTSLGIKNKGVKTLDVKELRLNDGPIVYTFGL